MEFEGLPDGCPPDIHNIDGIAKAYRVLVGSAATDYDWQSHHERGQTPEGCCPCRARSISLFLDPKTPKKYKNLKSLTHAVEVSIPAGRGAHVIKGSHIDFWPAKGVDVSTFTVSVVGI